MEFGVSTLIWVLGTNLILGFHDWLSEMGNGNSTFRIESSLFISMQFKHELLVRGLGVGEHLMNFNTLIMNHQHYIYYSFDSSFSSFP